MINSASKCLKITLKNFQNQKKKTFPQKLKLRGESFEGRLIPLWQKPCMHVSSKNKISTKISTGFAKLLQLFPNMSKSGVLIQCSELTWFH
jgi:hypothetical protein